MTGQSILAGLLIVGVGSLIVIYTEALLSFAGTMNWAEKWLRTFGGSRLGYKLIGIGAIIIGLMMMTGLLGPVVLSLFGGLFSGLGPTVR